MPISHGVLFEISRNSGIQVSKHFIDKVKVELLENVNLMLLLFFSLLFSFFTQVQRL